MNELLENALKTDEQNIIVSGNLKDYQMRDGKLTYLPQALLDDLYNEGFVVVQVSRSAGVHIFRRGDYKGEREKVVNQHLAAAGLQKLPKACEIAQAEGLRIFLENLHSSYSLGVLPYLS